MKDTYKIMIADCDIFGWYNLEGTWFDYDVVIYPDWHNVNESYGVDMSWL